MPLPDAVNPYDFAHAVTDPQVFAGRREQLEEAEYYLRLAASQRPTSLAVIGERSSGKSSFMNMIRLQAERYGLVSFRMDLDSSVVQTRTQFLRQFFEAALLSVCRAGLYEGRTGQVYQTVRQLLDGWEVPSDLTWVRFALPLQIARASAAGHLESLTIPVTTLADDFRQLTEDLVTDGVATAMVGLIDEANLLSLDQSLLETLRNLVETTPSLMLVLAGTGEFLPVMRDVFSPITRQFKVIPLGPFTSRQEARECVFRPLRKIGVEKPEECINLRTVHELTNVAGNRPYELQLICHMMYKRAVRAGGEMVLSTAVLDDVFLELDAVRGTDRSRIRQKLDALDHLHLTALCQCLTPADLSLDRVGALRIALAPSEPSMPRVDASVAGIQLAYASLKDRGLLEESDDGVRRLPGDEINDIYLKYYAEARGISAFREPPRAQQWVPLQVLGLAGAHDIEPYGNRGLFGVWPLGDLLRFHQRVTEVAEKILSGGYQFEETDQEVIFHLEETSRMFPQDRSRPVCLLRIEHTRDLPAVAVLLVHDDAAVEVATQHLSGLACALEQRLAMADARLLEVTMLSEPVIGGLDVLGALGGEDACEVAATIGANRAICLHEEGDTAGCVESLETLVQLHPSNGTLRNNLAYCYLLQGEWRKALDEAERAAANSDMPLLRYNLAIANLMTGQKETGVSMLVDIAASDPPDADEPLEEAHCLLVPVPGEDSIALAELHAGVHEGLAVARVAALALLVLDAGDASHLRALDSLGYAGRDLITAFRERQLGTSGTAADR
ncbi:hypothetical protein LLH23_04920 [bacterium]|nr:hypothetical protein [bacterium]